MSNIVYKITNMVNGMLYIGVTCSGIELRWKEHVHALNDLRTAHRPLYVAMRRHGTDKFTIEQIDDCPDEKTMYKRELEFIKDLATVYPNGYNLYGRKLTDEEAAIVKFNVFGWTLKQYANLFDLSVGTISNIRSERWSPYTYITKEHLPKDTDQIVTRALRLKEVRKQKDN